MSPLLRLCAFDCVFFPLSQQRDNEIRMEQTCKMNPNIPGDTDIYYSYLLHIVLQWLRKIQYSEKVGHDLVHYKYPFREIVL
jgi:hypothetical protein